MATNAIKRSPVRVILIKSSSYQSGGAGPQSIGANQAIADSGEWSSYAALYEEFKINSIEFVYHPSWSPTSESMQCIMTHGCIHNPVGTISRSAPTSLVDTLEKPVYHNISTISRKNAAFKQKVPVNPDYKGWFATEDEAADNKATCLTIGWLESPLVSKTFGFYQVIWDVSFK